MYTAMYTRVHDMTKPRFTDIELTKLTVRDIMNNSMSANGEYLGDYTIIMEVVGGSGGLETIPSPTKESVEAAMNRLHASASTEGVVSLRIKHTQDSDKLLALHIKTLKTEYGGGGGTRLIYFGNSFVEVNYNPLRNSLTNIVVKREKK